MKEAANRGGLADSSSSACLPARVLPAKRRQVPGADII